MPPPAQRELLETQTQSWPRGPQERKTGSSFGESGVVSFKKKDWKIERNPSTKRNPQFSEKSSIFLDHFFVFPELSKTKISSSLLSRVWQLHVQGFQQIGIVDLHRHRPSDEAEPKGQQIERLGMSGERFGEKLMPSALEVSKSHPLHLAMAQQAF